MGREPRDYAIWAAIVHQRDGQYAAIVDALTLDYRGQREKLTEKKVFASRAEAIEGAYELAREISRRLAAEGNTISSVQVDTTD